MIRNEQRIYTVDKVAMEFGAFSLSLEQQLANHVVVCTDTNKLALLQLHARSVYSMLVGKLMDRSEAIKIEHRIVEAIAEIVEELK